MPAPSHPCLLLPLPLPRSHAAAYVVHSRTRPPLTGLCRAPSTTTSSPARRRSGYNALARGCRPRRPGRRERRRHHLGRRGPPPTRRWSRNEGRGSRRGERMKPAMPSGLTSRSRSCRRPCTWMPPVRAPCMHACMRRRPRAQRTEEGELDVDNNQGEQEPPPDLDAALQLCRNGPEPPLRHLATTLLPSSSTLSGKPPPHRPSSSPCYPVAMRGTISPP